MTFETFDPRTIGKEVYQELKSLRSPYEALWHKTQQEKDKKLYYDHLKEQKNQAVQLYTYISTWGLLRLKAEEIALDKTKLGENPSSKFDYQKKAETSQEGKKEVIESFFKCLEKLSETYIGLSTLSVQDSKNGIDTDTYLGLTGLALEIAQEFSFWANTVYHDISGEE